jgi:hypothetical protein
VHFSSTGINVFIIMFYIRFLCHFLHHSSLYSHLVLHQKLLLASLHTPIINILSVSGPIYTTSAFILKATVICLQSTIHLLIPVRVNRKAL